MTTTSTSARPETRATRSVHMIRAELDVNAFHRWAGSRGLISRNAFDEGFAMHCLLVESFGELAPKPFRVIIPRDRRRNGVLYGYCQSDVDALREAAAAYADPLQGKILPATRIDSKAMPSSWERGRRLGFEVLVRPIVRPAKGDRRAGKEIDAFQREACRYPKGGMERTRENVYTDWLADRLDGRGAQLNGARLTSFQRVRTVRKLRTHATEGPRAVMQGTLTVTDPHGFQCLVAHGIGRHKAYGYGMLLLRPAINANGR